MIPSIHIAKSDLGCVAHGFGAPCTALPQRPAPVCPETPSVPWRGARRAGWHTVCLCSG
ncbi:hypothetical protein L537_0992 [Bordetella hinzii 1277]|nr:hypothetical protein L537_0992 [Bordetella hinzii 1277]